MALGRVVTVAMVVATVSGSPSPIPSPQTGRVVKRAAWTTSRTLDGISVGIQEALSGKEFGTSGSGRPRRPVSHANPQAQPTPARVFQYAVVPSCAGNAVGGMGEACASAFGLCPQGSGPLSVVWRRDVTTASAPGQWASSGTTCLPGSVASAGAVASPGLTYADIRSEWARTPFARAGLVIQPPGLETLVNLPTYFAVSWGQGFGPGQARTVTLLGHQVAMRPVLRHFEYDFGGGQSMRTMSPGGSYPDGDVRHTYLRSGRVSVQVIVIYGGEYAVDDGSWFPIAETIRIAGPASTLAVLTAENRLIPD